jgi:hypothetical protein
MNNQKFRALVILLLCCPAAACSARQAGVASTVSEPTLQPFIARTNAYVAERTRIEQQLPKLTGEEEPEQIKDRQEKLRAAIRTARTGAREGDIFTREAEPAIRDIIRSEFRGPDGQATRLTVMEENPGPFKCEVNGVYPEDRPVSTVPLELLGRLPKLPDDLEYRFVGRHLILRDAKTNLIVDCMRDVVQ